MPCAVIFVVDPNLVPVLVRRLDSSLVFALVLDVYPNLIPGAEANVVLGLESNLIRGLDSNLVFAFLKVEDDLPMSKR